MLVSSINDRDNDDDVTKKHYKGKDEADSLELLLKQAVAPRGPFSDFCEETTLNGWYYLSRRGVGLIGRSYWSLVVLASLGAAGFFCHGTTSEWLDSSVIITVDSVSASLDKVVYPAITVCNQNQVLLILRRAE